MSDIKPSLILPILLTIVALGDLIVTFYSANDDSPFTIILIAEIVLIAIAISSWVSYFKSNIRYKIEQSQIKKGNSVQV